MKQEDLTCLKHVGTARMKILHDSGIMTVRQLHEMPLEKLSEIKSIGGHYSRLIKNSAGEYFGENPTKLYRRTAYSQQNETIKIDRDLKKKIRKLQKILNRVNENLKPLWDKKYLKLYVEFKKRFKKLKVHLRALGVDFGTISPQDKKTIIKKASILIENLKNVGKNPKKKKYKQATQDIRSFSKYIRKIIS